MEVEVIDTDAKSCNDKVAALGHAMLGLPQVEMPVWHHFAPGVYAREIFMPAGTIVVGHKHKTEHLNIITQGECIVSMDGRVMRLKAGGVVKSNEGCQKAFYIISGTKWITIHPTEETDMDKLEEIHIEKSKEFLEFEELTRLKAAMNGGAA